MIPHGQIYITGGIENAHLHKAKYFKGKRFMHRRTFLSKSEANGAADANRGQGHLARVVPRMVWINHAGWELGTEKVQGYVLYVHYNTDDKPIRTKKQQKEDYADSSESRYLEAMDRADRAYQTEW